MTYESLLETERLANLNLRAVNGKLEITWPSDANIYHMTLGRHLSPESRDRLATIFERPDATFETLTFAEVETAAFSLASKLRSLGYGRGDLVGIHTGQHPYTAVAHMAVCLLGGTAVTLSQLYGPDSLSHAINDCKVRVLLTAAEAWSELRSEAASLFPDLEHVFLRAPLGGELDLADAFNCDATGFEPDFSGADDPALLMYTSGSTGMPKGILHGHRVLAAYTPSINLFFDLSMDDEDAVYWSPSDWAWVGGLLDMLFPAWMAGRPIATSLDRFNAEWAYGFMARTGVTHAFLAPTAIKRLATTEDPRRSFDLAIRVICTGGEALASETLKWAEDELGVVCNEFYGMTEVNHLIGNCAALFPRRPGSMGRAYPGHDVRLVDESGSEVMEGETGEIVTSSDSPTRFLGYLNNPEKESEMRLGSYLRTKDLAVRDEDGYFWYKGRNDDVIKSSGFRIGPTEVEECLISHRDVAEAAVVGKPDPERGSIVKAFVKPSPGVSPSEKLSLILIEHVRKRLAAYKAPREIEFVEQFEMTSSAKINRRSLREAEKAKAAKAQDLSGS
ncbi:MAG: AMP-binding protein [Albidovulum sp.]|nr:AMP-binding protein [Albidovulum sp.]